MARSLLGGEWIDVSGWLAVILSSMHTWGDVLIN